MKKLLFILFVCFVYSAKSQVYQLMPQYGYEAKRMSFDSTLQIPTICGAPTLKTLYNVKRSAIAFDSCNNRFYAYNPKTTTWTLLGSGGGGGWNIVGNTTLTGDVTIATPYKISFVGTDENPKQFNVIADNINLDGSNLKITALSNVSDTNLYKPLAIDFYGQVFKMDNWVGGSGSSIDTTGAFLISVNQPNDSTLTFQKGATATSYTIRTAVAKSATRLVTAVYNNSGSTITKGSVVYINGRHSSELPTIALAQANTEANSYSTFALVENDIPTSSSGVAIQAGNIGNLNLPTSSYTDGQIVYLSPTTAGGLTTTKPLAPNHIVKIGTITRAHPTLGSIELKIENGWQLDELSDVQIPAVPNDSTLLQFSRVDSLWHSVSVNNAIGTKYIKPSDTASMLTNYQRSITAMKYSDTATMLSKYFRKTDTTTLSNRINLKVNISDTATMLTPYQRSITAVKYSDTATMLSPYVRNTPTIAYLSSDFNTTNTTATSTNLSIAVEANTAYRIMINGTASKATSSTGLKIAIAAPTGTTIKANFSYGANAINTIQNAFITAINTLYPSTAFSTAIATEMPFRIEGILVTGSTAGSVTLQGATVTSNTATIYANTLMTLNKAYAQ